MFLFNVTDPAYGGKGDCVFLNNGVMTNGSANLFSIGFPFSVSDVGKKVYVVGHPTTAQIGTTGVGTIVAFVDAQNVTLSAVANYSSAPHSQVVYGTDDTAAFLLAYTAAATLAPPVYKSIFGTTQGVVYAPAGGYWVSSRFYDGSGSSVPPGFMGDGPDATSIFPSPDCTIPGDGSPVLMRLNGGFGMRIGGFGLAGPNKFWSMQAGQSLIECSGSQRLKMQDITANGFASVLGGQFMKFSGCQSMTLNDFHLQISAGSFAQSGSNLLDGMYLTGTNGDINNCINSDWYRCYVIEKNPSRVGGEITPQGFFGGPMLNINGGTTDDPISGIGVVMQNYGYANFNNTCIWGQDLAGIPALQVDGTSKIWLNSTDCGMYTPAQRQAYAITIAAGGDVYASMSTIRGDRLDDKNVVNDGNFHDAGGNVFMSAKTGHNLPISWRSSFTRPNGVIRG